MFKGRGRISLSWALLGFVGVSLAVGGYWLLFTTFMVYDDEGYVLISLRNYSLHGGLYDLVYTQYGPFPYVLYDALHRLLGFAFTNTSGRWITLINWLATAIACAAIVGRTTRSAIWAAVTLAGTFVYLWIMINEPIHPGGLIAAVVAGSVWLAAEAWRARRTLLFSAITGLASAALILTKINVGIFFVGTTLVWLAVNTAPRKRARLLTWLAAVACVALPFGLMRSLMDAQWVSVFALVFAAGSLSAILASRHVAEPVVSGRAWLIFGATAVASIAAVCAIPLGRGSSLHGLLLGIVLEPLKHPGVYFFPMRWQAGAALTAVVSLAVAGATLPFAKTNPYLKELIGWSRVIIACVFFFASMGLTSTSMSHWGLSYGLSLAWVFVVPLRSNLEGAPERAWVALMLVFQSLQAYPVAGSQLSWGTYLWIPLVALGVVDAGPMLALRLNRSAAWVTRLSMAALAAIAVFMAGNLTRIGWNRYFSSQRLELPGAADIRVPNDLTYALRVANENLRAHADMLFTFPGLYSANLWTGLPTPTLANATHWFSLLSVDRQQAIIDQLEHHPQAAIFVQHELVDYLDRNGFRAHGLLYTWIIQHFHNYLNFGGYEIWFRSGRSIAPLSTVRVNRSAHGAVQSLTLTLRSPSAPIAKLDLCDINSPRDALVTIDAKEVSIAPCNLDGTPAGPSRVSSLPVSFNGIAQITVKFTAEDQIPGWARPLLVLRGSNGAVLGELIMIQ